MPRKLKTYQTSQGFYACHRPRELTAFGFWSLAAGAVWLDRMFSRLAGAQRGNRIEENPFQILSGVATRDSGGGGCFRHGIRARLRHAIWPHK
jgi:hypothetical protein